MLPAPDTDKSLCLTPASIYLRRSVTRYIDRLFEQFGASHNLLLKLPNKVGRCGAMLYISSFKYIRLGMSFPFRSVAVTRSPELCHTPLILRSFPVGWQSLADIDIMAAANRLSRLPAWVSYWLGYRPPHANQNKPLPQYLVCIWSFIGGFCGLAVISATFGHSQYFVERQVPPIVASYVCCHQIFCLSGLDSKRT